MCILGSAAWMVRNLFISTSLRTHLKYKPGFREIIRPAFLGKQTFFRSEHTGGTLLTQSHSPLMCHDVLPFLSQLGRTMTTAHYSAFSWSSLSATLLRPIPLSQLGVVSYFEPLL